MNDEGEIRIKISKKKIWQYAAFLLLGVLLVGGFVAFKGSRSPTGNVITTGGGPGEVVEVKTVIQGFKYNPDKITVKENSLVKLTIQSKDNVVHGLHLPQFGLVDSIPPLATKTVQFKAVEGQTNGQALPTCTQEHGETLTFNVV